MLSSPLQCSGEPNTIGKIWEGLICRMLIILLYSMSCISDCYRWSNLKKRVALGKQRIGPRIQAKGDIISQDLSSFGQIFSALREKFEASNCLQHHCPRQQALGLIGGFSKELKALQAQARDLIELQELLETSVFNFSLLKK